MADRCPSFILGSTEYNRFVLDLREVLCVLYEFVQNAEHCPACGNFVVEGWESCPNADDADHLD